MDGNFDKVGYPGYFYTSWKKGKKPKLYSKENSKHKHKGTVLGQQGSSENRAFLDRECIRNVIKTTRRATA